MSKLRFGVSQKAGWRLAVESHQVVCREDPDDRGSALGAGVRPMPVVVMQPARERGAPRPRCRIRAYV